MPRASYHKPAMDSDTGWNLPWIRTAPVLSGAVAGAQGRPCLQTAGSCRWGGRARIAWQTRLTVCNTVQPMKQVHPVCAIAGVLRILEGPPIPELSCEQLHFRARACIRSPCWQVLSTWARAGRTGALSSNAAPGNEY